MSAYAQRDTGAGVEVVQDLAFIFDPLGNLIQRADARQGLVETFLYDSLNRVTTVETLTGGDTSTTSFIQPVSMWSGGNTATVDISYDALGNMGAGRKRPVDKPWPGRRLH